MTRTGVYCMSNDGFADWTIAFLESFRRYNPTTELIIVPFDDRIDRIAALAPRYNFTLLQDEPLLQRLDRIGNDLFHEDYPRLRRQKMIRKFAVFHGPLDQFLYLDADIVALSRLDLLMGKLLGSGADFSFFDTSTEFVYADLSFRRHMEAEFGSRSFSSGSFISSRGFIALEELSEVCREKDRLKRVFHPLTSDQPYLNYLVDVKRAKVAASYEIVPELLPGTWAGEGPVDIGAKRLRKLGTGPVTRGGKTLPFLHWAGFECNRRMPNLEYYLHFRLQAEQSWISRMSFRYKFRHW